MDIGAIVGDGMIVGGTVGEMKVGGGSSVPHKDGWHALTKNRIKLTIAIKRGDFIIPNYTIRV